MIKKIRLNLKYFDLGLSLQFIQVQKYLELKKSSENYVTYNKFMKYSYQ